MHRSSLCIGRNVGVLAVTLVVGLSVPRTAAAQQGAELIIYGGIHYTFDTTSSQGVCVPLGDYVVTNVLRPRFQ